MSETITAKSRRTEIVIAVIGLVGVLFTAAASNWDKMFGHVVTAQYSGYEPTGNFETELRYLLEVNGTRKMMSDMQEQILQTVMGKLKSEMPNDAAKIAKLADVFKKDAPTFDESLQSILPIYQKYFTVAELQELNRFYSTPVMQEMVRKQPAITRELAPQLMETMESVQQKMLKDVVQVLSEDEAKSERPK